MYSTPSASLRVTSLTSSSMVTFVAWVRLMGGGTLGAKVSVATSSPCTDGSDGFKVFELFSAAFARLQDNTRQPKAALNRFICLFIFMFNVFRFWSARASNHPRLNSLSN